MEFEHIKLIIIPLCVAAIPVIIAIWHFRVKLERDLSMRPTFGHTQEMHEKMHQDILSLKTDMRNDIVDLKADFHDRVKHNLDEVIRRLDNHGAKIDKTMIAAERALLLAETNLKRHEE